MGSRLTVLTVAPPIWQDAVRVLITVEPVVLIDVRNPARTCSGRWRRCVATRPRWVLIGDLSRPDALLVQPADPVPPNRWRGISPHCWMARPCLRTAPADAPCPASRGPCGHALTGGLIEPDGARLTSSRANLPDGEPV